MYDLGELIGRYVLTGVILWGLLFVMLVIRLLYVAFTPGNGGMDFIEKFDSSLKGTKVKNSKAQTIFEFTVWPYGMIRLLNAYFQLERSTMAIIHKEEEAD